MGLDNPLHIAFLLLVVLLVFGAKRLPELGRSLGSGMRGFRDAISGAELVPALAAPTTPAPEDAAAPGAVLTVASPAAGPDGAALASAPPPATNAPREDPPPAA
jgi:sec-independent protein translocase protein TatA